MRAPLRELDNWKLSDKDKDIRGWEVRTPDGRRIGKVTEMIADTDTQHVEAIVLDNGQEYPVSSLEIGDNEVHLAGTGTDGRHVRGENRKEILIPVLEEQVEIGKRETVRGGVRVESHLKEEDVSETVTLRSTDVHVERHEVDRPATEEDLREAGQSMEAFNTVEEPTVSKTTRVVGEVVISKDVTEEEKTIRETARKTDVKVDRVDPTDTKHTQGRKR